MTGTIRKRGQRSWGVRFDIGRDPATGKRRFRYLSVKGTKADARRALTEVLHEHDTGTDVARSRITVSEFLNRWLSDHAAMNAAPSTLTRYRQIVERLAPLVGALQLQELRPPHIQDAYARLLEDGLAPRTVLHHHRVLREALQQALRWQILTRNPADAVTPPRPKDREMRALRPEEVRLLLDACPDPDLQAVIHTAVTTGLRLGELLGLRWQDLDLDAATATITRAAQYLPQTGVTVRPPKTARGRRTIALSDETLQTLHAHRARQLAHRLALGPAHQDEDLVFPAANGALQPPYRVSQRFHRLVASTALGPVRFHDLRHTAATLALRAGVPIKIVSTRLGHSTSSLTLDTYSHVTVDMQRDAAAAIDEVLRAH
ncbi:MAG TPA: tyrosine-type recombinase/integrase [Dehalococcoidia bacterium]|nr:tyrosine-type recombinase/integrase [Dehalococcoidia bacterium]